MSRSEGHLCHIFAKLLHTPLTAACLARSTRSVFTAEELARQLEIHYTPKHGSWLNIAEIESSVLSRQCLDRRIESTERLESECHAWNVERNELQKGVDWQFTTADARIKLKRLYPQIQY